AYLAVSREPAYTSIGLPGAPLVGRARICWSPGPSRRLTPFPRRSLLSLPSVVEGDGRGVHRATTPRSPTADPGGPARPLRAHRGPPRTGGPGTELRHRLPHPARAPAGVGGERRTAHGEPRPGAQPTPHAARRRLRRAALRRDRGR